MTAVHDSELVATFLMVMCLPQIGVCYTYLFDIGFRVMTQAETTVMSFMILPLVGVCALTWLIMGIGYWIDSGGLDV